VIRREPRHEPALAEHREMRGVSVHEAEHVERTCGTHERVSARVEAMHEVVEREPAGERRH
jgi:hypothetical protein